MINFIFKTNFGKKQIPEYPSDFCIIEFSPLALKENIKDDQNKIIYRYLSDGFGNVIRKKYRYSRARLKSLKEIQKIPIYDKTKGEIRFPIFAKILPSEVSYER